MSVLPLFEIIMLSILLLFSYQMIFFVFVILAYNQLIDNHESDYLGMALCFNVH